MAMTSKAASARENKSFRAPGAHAVQGDFHWAQPPHRLIQTVQSRDGALRRMWKWGTAATNKAPTGRKSPQRYSKFLRFGPIAERAAGELAPGDLEVAISEEKDPPAWCFSLADGALNDGPTEGAWARGAQGAATIDADHTAERIVRLYEGWNKPEQAAAWKPRFGLPDLPAEIFASP
jgi:hypothetical protein